MMRLQKYLSRCGVASRRHAEKMIEQRRVTVNGQVIDSQGISVDENSDEVFVDGVRATIIDEKETYMLNKPLGYVTTMDDPQGRPTVAHFVREVSLVGGFPIGRLDVETTGLLLLTNDGDLAQKLSHPSKGVEKTYIAKIDKALTQKDLKILKSGVDIGDYVTREAKVELEGDDRHVKITIHEGKNRQIRRMFKALGYRVLELERIKYGLLSLGNLKCGEARKLNKDEIFELCEQ